MSAEQETLVTVTALIDPVKGVIFNAEHVSRKEARKLDIKRMGYLKEAVQGSGALISHPEMEQDVEIALLFLEARQQFSRSDINCLDLFVNKSDYKKWALKGNFTLGGEI